MKNNVIRAFVLAVSSVMFSSVVVSAKEDIMALDNDIPVKTPVGLATLAAFLVGLAISIIVIRIMAGKMNTIGKQKSAITYEKGLELTKKSDVYLYSHTSTRVRQ